MTKKVTIRINLFVETALNIEVSLDENGEQATIHSAERLMLQPDVDADRMGEHLSDVDWEFIEEEAAKALGIERG